MEYQEEINYNNIVDTLFNTFGEVLSRDVVYNIVEHFGGNLEESANAVMNIIMDENNTTTRSDLNTRINGFQQSTEDAEHSENAVINIIMDENHAEVTNMQPDLRVNAFEQTTINHNQNHNQTETYNLVSKTHNNTSVLSYANASQIAKEPVFQAPKTPGIASDGSINVWTSQLQQILAHHENGVRTLIVMRGIPGSGKTYLAKKIIDAIYYTRQQHYCTHIFSTDSYFIQRGVYLYDKMRLPEAHEWNQSRAKKAMTDGVSPVIIDNTNVELWEMEYYVAEGVKNGYMIEVVEPNTPWARKVNQLFRKNSHNVPLAAIRRMLDNFQSGITGTLLLKKFGLHYSPLNKPPVLRTKPPFSLPEQSTSSDNPNASDNSNSNEILHSNIEPQWILTENTTVSSIPGVSSENVIVSEDTASSSSGEQSSSEKINNLDQFVELQKCLEEIEKVEKEWDNGDNWEDNSRNQNQDSKNLDPIDSKPQRSYKLMRSTTTEKFLPSTEMYQDWSKCSSFLPSWGESSNSTLLEFSMPVVEKRNSSTCVEYGDTAITISKNPLKIITAVSRNINEYHVATNNKKIPEKWMLDKSTSTSNNQIFTDTFRCQNEEQHFNAFRKLFKKVARADLRDIFDNCCGDVNWAVDIVLDSMASNKLDILDSNDHSDTEPEAQNANIDTCQCLSVYNIIPDYQESVIPQVTEENERSADGAVPPSIIKKGRKENLLSETSMQLKRQIEQNVVISDNHYSEHCLKIRKIRRGEYYDDELEKSNGVLNTVEATGVNLSENNVASTSENLNASPSDCCTPSTSKMNNITTETGDEDPAPPDNAEKTVNVNLGKEFIKEIDELFGRRNMEYPANVIPRINIRMSLLNEINALWMESLMYQIEEDAKQSEIMVQQDEEFARELAKKEDELTQAGKEPEVPDFKEIMDMDFALSLYHKNIAEWRHNVPEDLAAKLSREKLYNLFPEVSPDVLSELLMAHDNNFQLTVEVLLISKGKSDILNTKDGINKFVMEKEMERQEMLLEKEKKAISEVEWPLLPKSETVDMAVVQQYRDDADKHLHSRNVHYQKAQDYIRRGMTQVASYYSDVAAFHKSKYEMANSMAAASLMQVHAANCTDNATIDLHYLRVGEAKESLDLFIDTHIQKLREMQDRNGVKFHTLYFITGRGRHSNGRPRIKPAVKKRLEERGLAFSERNPGLLTAKVCADDKLSYQIA